MIVELLKNIVESIPVDSNDPTGIKYLFFDGREDVEANENDGQTQSYCFLIHPIQSKATISNSGRITREYPVRLLFLGNSKLPDQQDVRQANFDAQRIALNSFYTKLNTDPLVDKINGQNEEEFYNILDDNKDGYLVSVNIFDTGESDCESANTNTENCNELATLLSSNYFDANTSSYDYGNWQLEIVNGYARFTRANDTLDNTISFVICDNTEAGNYFLVEFDIVRTSGDIISTIDSVDMIPAISESYHYKKVVMFSGGGDFVILIQTNTIDAPIGFVGYVENLVVRKILETKGV